MRPERGGRSKLRRRGGARGEEGRAAGPLRASPGRAGLPRPPGSRERAGRTQGEVSSCFPWLERGAAAARGAGTLAPGQGDSFFLFKASSLPPGGARVCGRVEAWGGRSPPQMPGPPEPAAAALGPLQLALTWDRWPPRRIPPGGAGRPAPTSAPQHPSGKPRLGEEDGPGPGVARLVGGQVVLEPRAPSPGPASLAHAGSHHPSVISHEYRSTPAH